MHIAVQNTVDCIVYIVELKTGDVIRLLEIDKLLGNEAKVFSAFKTCPALFIVLGLPAAGCSKRNQYLQNSMN